MPKQYKYKITFSGGCAEATHGTITQKQAHFYLKNFNYDDVNTYIQFYAEELDATGLIPEEYQLGMWHELDDAQHINAPFFSHVSMFVEDEDGNEQSFYNLNDVIKGKNVIGETGDIEKHYKDNITIDDEVDIYSYQSEKGGFYVENEDYDNDDLQSDNGYDYSLVLNEPFDIKKVKAVIEDYDGDKFLTQIQYEEDTMTLIGDGSTGKGSGTYFDEDTMMEDCEVMILDDVTKKKIQLVLEGHMPFCFSMDALNKKYDKVFGIAS